MKRCIAVLGLAFALIGLPAWAQTPVYGVTGTVRQLLVPVYFQGEQPNTVSAADLQTAAAAAHQVYDRDSWQQMDLQTDIGPWLYFDRAPTCDYTTDQLLITPALQATGYDTRQLAQYRLITAYLAGGRCSNVSHAQVGGRVIVLGFLRSLAHEIGHSLGLNHDFQLTCAADFTTCSGAVENADPTSIMGYGGAFNSPERMRLGWVGSAYRDITANGAYDLDALEAPLTSRPKVLRVALVNAPLGQGVLWAESRGTNALVLHTGDSPDWPYYRLLTVLYQGQSVTFGGATITNLATSVTGSTVGVTLLSAAPVDCVQGDWTIQSVSVAPWSAWVTVGDHQERTQVTTTTWTRDTTTEPANGGSPCGPSTMTTSTTATETRPIPDTTPPVVTISATQNGKSHNWTLVVGATDASGVPPTGTVFFDGAPVAVLINGAWTGTLGLKGNGTHTVTVIATDAAGNTTTATKTFG